MAEDNNKLDRIEELKTKLFSRKYETKIEHRDNYSPRGILPVPDSWKDPENIRRNAETFFSKTSRFRKLFFISLAFFALALMYAGYVFFAGGNVVSNDNIDITVEGNSFTSGGDELPLIVSITNRNSTALELVDLVMDYPKGSPADMASADMEHFRESLGTIPAGAIRNENVKVTLFGEQGSTRTIRFSVEYRVAGSSAIFVKEKDYPITISSTPINLSVDGPDSVSPSQDVTLNIKETLNATAPAQNVLLKATYPVGFQFVSATPAPSYGNNIWDLGDLAPGAEHDVTISGKMIDVFDGEQKTFNIATGSQSSADKSSIDVVYNSATHNLTIKKAFVEANLYINGESKQEYAVSDQTPIDAEIRYANNADTAINNLSIVAKLSGNALSPGSVKAPQGFYDSSKNTITWDKGTFSDFAQVNPGDSGTVSFSLAPIPLVSPGGSLLKDPAINVEIDASGEQGDQSFATEQLVNSSSATIKVISNLGFVAKALFGTGAFSDTGPLPPKAGEITTYTIVWTLSNSANSISSAQVVASLPPWMSFTNKISPATEKLTYNNSNGQITWNVGRLEKGAGVSGPGRSVSFQVALKPSVSQVGTVPILVNGAVLTGHDDFANVDVRVSKSPVNAKLDSGDSGVVTQ